ncbi:methyltransferase domain-containing protein [Candidatus Hydrogenedentota bacterium]
MSHKLEQIFPWGRSMEEYIRMFALTSDDLGLRIVGCADGPAGFNSEATNEGATVTSCDPLYQFSTDEIRGRIAAHYDDRIRGAEAKRDQFVWDVIKSPEEMGRLRMAAMEEFLSDYDKGKAEGRYVNESLPSLPFADKEFDLALCSHFLFLYTHCLSLEFHLKCIREMCRVAKEARIFPLLNFNSRASEYAEQVTETLRQEGYEIKIERVQYEFQRGGHTMMRVRK